MAARGVGPGDRVAVMVPNGASWFEANVATARLGAQLVPLNWHLLAEEISWILADADARLLIADRRLQTTATEALSRVPGCGALFVDDGFEDELDRAAPAPRTTSGTVTPALVLYTSGTTGRPKGVVHEQSTTARSRQSHVELWGFTPDDVHPLVAPAYHAAPWPYAMTPLVLAATRVAIPP